MVSLQVKGIQTSPVCIIIFLLEKKWRFLFLDLLVSFLVVEEYHLTFSLSEFLTSAFYSPTPSPPPPPFLFLSFLWETRMGDSVRQPPTLNSFSSWHFDFTAVLHPVSPFQTPLQIQSIWTLLYLCPLPWKCFSVSIKSYLGKCFIYLKNKKVCIFWQNIVEDEIILEQFYFIQQGKKIPDKYLMIQYKSDFLPCYYKESALVN